MEVNYREENIRKLRSMYRHLYLFGAGKYCNYLLEYIGDIAREIFEGIVVSKLEDNPKCVAGMMVRKISDVAITDDDAIIVAVYDNVQLLECLHDRGYKNVIPIQKIMPVRDEDQKAYEISRNLEIKRYIEDFEQEPQLFKYIEIETVNRCNGECSFCPVNKNEKQRVYHKMSVEMFENIINQLSSLEYKGLLALFSNNEAFLDDRIVQFAQYAREKVPHAYIYIISNGKLITLDKFKKIIPYLDLIQIDNYEIYEEKGKNIIEIEEEIARQGIQNKYIYWEVDKRALRSSRGGNAPNMKIYYSTETLCPLPFVQMVIRPDGKVSLCCNDALGENTLGDINKNSLLEIWNSDAYREVRETVKNGRYGLSTCRYCNTIDNRELWKTGQYGV